MTSRSTMTSASPVPSRDIEVSPSHAADERSLRGTREPSSRDRQQWLRRIVVAVVAVCAAILVAAAIARIGRMKSDRAASLSERAHAFPASRGITDSRTGVQIADLANPKRTGACNSRRSLRATGAVPKSSQGNQG
jgi:hypothetical protein